MLFVWDEPKRMLNLAKHGLDFADFETGFAIRDCVILRTRPSRNGRPRSRLIGLFRNEIITAAIVSPLGSEALSIVSFRHADPAERRLYEQRQP